MSDLELELPAKINLGLSIRGRTTNGYHHVDTVMAKIPLHDTLQVDFLSKGEPTSLECCARRVPRNGENLLMRVYEILAREYELPPARMTLTKRIPVGAGMSGGSSDAGGLLVALNQYFKLGIANESMRTIALQLGADVPFATRRDQVTFEHDHGLASLVSERLPNLPPMSLAVVHQKLFLSTEKMYRAIDEVDFMPSNLAELIAAVRASDLNKIAANLTNDFSRVVDERYPQVAQVREKLFDGGALGVGLSGKGPTLYAIFSPGQKPPLALEVQWYQLGVDYD